MRHWTRATMALLPSSSARLPGRAATTTAHGTAAIPPSPCARSSRSRADSLDAALASLESALAERRTTIRRECARPSASLARGTSTSRERSSFTRLPSPPHSIHDARKSTTTTPHRRRRSRRAASPRSSRCSGRRSIHAWPIRAGASSIGMRPLVTRIAYAAAGAARDRRTDRRAHAPRAGARLIARRRRLRRPAHTRRDRRGARARSMGCAIWPTLTATADGRASPSNAVHSTGRSRVRRHTCARTLTSRRSTASRSSRSTPSPRATRLDSLRRIAHTTPIRIPRAWRADAPSIYSPGAFDATAYAPTTAPRSSPALVALGARLFGDPRLSGPQTRSCASCHQPSKAFSDGVARPSAIRQPPAASDATPRRSSTRRFNRRSSPTSARRRSRTRCSRCFAARRRWPAPRSMRRRFWCATRRIAPRSRARSAASPDTTVTPLRVRQSLAAYLRTLTSMRVAVRSRTDRRHPRADRRGASRLRRVHGQGRVRHVPFRAALRRGHAAALPVVGRRSHRHDRLADVPRRSIRTRAARGSITCRSTSGRSRRRRCAMSRAPRRTCTTVRSVRSTTSSRSTITAADWAPARASPIRR